MSHIIAMNASMHITQPCHTQYMYTYNGRGWEEGWRDGVGYGGGGSGIWRRREWDMGGEEEGVGYGRGGGGSGIWEGRRREWDVGG